MPPWPASEPVPHNLAAPLTSLVGREQELADITNLLAHDRLITLVGPAGIGKTRLAVHCAAQALAEHPDGAWFVDLSLVTEPHLVIRAVALALGVRSSPGEPLLDAVTTFLDAKAVLLMLDNCEHLAHACAELVCRLLPACGSLTILATSREKLGVVGEVAWTVPPLQPPSNESPAEVTHSDAARLFLARSEASTEVTEATASTIARICRRLDGLPLAIELAASRVGELTIEEVEARLDQRFELLRSDQLGFPERQQTLHAALEWSYELIPEPERALLRRMAVFAGSFTAAAALHVCSADRVGGNGVASVVGRLAAKSLLVRREDDGHLRYRMLESIRCFALEKLRAAGEEDDLRAAHARWCAALAAGSDSGPATPEQAESAVRLGDVHADLRAALAWTTDHDPDLGVALAGDLARFWVAHGHLDEGREWLQAALAAATSAAPARAKALWGSGLIACLLGDFPAVRPAVEEGLALARSAHDGPILARLLNLVGVTRIFTDPPEAIDALKESVDLARQHHETTTLVSSLAMLGFARALCGDLDAASAVLEECLASGDDAGEIQPMVMGLVGLGHVRVHQGDPYGARALLDEGLAMARRVGNPIWVALALAFRAELDSLLGEHAQARSLVEEAVAVSRRTGAKPVIGLCLAVAATVELGAGDPTSSIPMFDEALALCDSGEEGGVRARALVGRARAHLDLGDPDAAQALLEEAVTLAEDGQNRAAAAAALHWLGRCAAGRDEHEMALGLHREALAAQNRAGHRVVIPTTVEAVASSAAHEGDVAKAARLVAAADSLRQQMGTTRSAESHADCESVEALAEEALGPDDRAAAATDGAQLPAERLVTYACEGRGPRKRPAFGWLSLTPTEQQVVELVAQHLTNGEIGARLLMAPNTVKTHLSRVYDKLGVRSRQEVVKDVMRRQQRSPG